MSVGPVFCRLPGKVGIHYGAVLGSSLLVRSPRLRIQLVAIWPRRCWLLPSEDFAWQRETWSVSKNTAMQNCITLTESNIQFSGLLRFKMVHSVHSYKLNVQKWQFLFWQLVCGYDPVRNIIFAAHWLSAYVLIYHCNSIIFLLLTDGLKPKRIARSCHLFIYFCCLLLPRQKLAHTLHMR